MLQNRGQQASGANRMQSVIPDLSAKKACQLQEASGSLCRQPACNLLLLLLHLPSPLLLLLLCLHTVLHTVDRTLCTMYNVPFIVYTMLLHKVLTKSQLHAVGAAATLLFFAPSYPLLLTGRVMYGLGIGFAMHAAPAYIAETAPASVRGLLIR